MNRQDIIERITTDTPPPWISQAGQYLLNWLMLVDHMANTLLLGNPHEPLTARIARARNKPVNLRGAELWNWGPVVTPPIADPPKIPDIPSKTVIVVPPSPQSTSFRIHAAVLRIHVKYPPHAR